VSGALGHLRVLDLSRVLAGPWASQILADLGADVIKVERPGSGDDTRHWGPPYLQDAAGRDTGEAAYYLSANRGKRSLTVDFTTPEGQDIVRRLAAQSDVFLENHKVGVAVADVMAGLYACVAILAALAHRDLSGMGQHIDLALLDVQVATLVNVALNYLVSGIAPQRWGNAHANIAPYQVVAAADRPLVLAIGNDAQFRKFCEVAGVPALADDPRFVTNDARVRHRDALTADRERVVRSRTAAAWLAALEPAGVPCAPINDLAQVFGDPQVRHRGMRVDVPHPSGATVPLVANPIRLSETPVGYDAPPPLLGQHTEEILRERLGFDTAQIVALRTRGVI
jgi:crotonobetainyl-CoA:carnitine CoA-transferase CaiB-like acyl-CoA transferase